MEPRLSFVTLGVDSVARSRAFYEALGFVASPASNENVTFFNAGGVVLSIFGRRSLAEDAHVSDSHPGFSGVALAHNVASERDVDRVAGEAVAAGAKLLKLPQKTFWGGYSAYFSDPDGHIWEVAHNPFFPLDAAGHVTLPQAVDHDDYPDAFLRGVLSAARTIAVVGASPSADRPSYGVMQFLMAKGYTVIPINPGHAGGEILGQRVYGSLADVREQVDMVDVFRKPEAVPGLVEDVLREQQRLAIKSIWMQLGVRDLDAAAKAEGAGLQVVMDRCLKIEIMRLGL